MMLVLAIGAALAAPPAVKLDADPLRPAFDGGGGIATVGAARGAELVARADLWWAHEVLVFYGASGEETPVIEDLVAVDVGAAAREGRVRVGLGLPVVAHASGTARESSGAVLGDLAAGVDIVALDAAEALLGLAPFARVDLPLGAGDYQLGQDGLTWELGLAAEHRRGSWRFTANLGTLGRPDADLGKVPQKDQLLIRAGLGRALGDSIVHTELLANAQYDRLFSEPTTTPVELLAHIARATDGGTALRVGGGVGLVPGVGAPMARVLVGVGHAPPAPSPGL